MDLQFVAHHWQVVIIARPRADKPYRHLASRFYSPHCLCPRTVQDLCLDVLRILSDDSHRISILQELVFAAENRDEDVDFMLPAYDYHSQREKKGANYKFPYLTACLILAMAECSCKSHRALGEYPGPCTDDEFHTDWSYPFDDYEECTEILEPTVVTVIDITDLHKPRYCFLSMNDMCIQCALREYNSKSSNHTLPDGGDAEDELPPSKMPMYTPSSGEAVAYDIHLLPHGSSNEKYSEVLQALKAYPLIEATALASCWPSTAWKSSEQTAADSNQLSLSASPEVPRSRIKSLGELARNKAVDAITSGLLEDLQLLDDLLVLPQFQRSFLATCAVRADCLATSEYQSTVAALLALLLEGVLHVDLYPFRKLPPATIREILKSDRLKDMKSLNLSGIFARPDIKELEDTLDAIPRQLECVYLLSPWEEVNNLGWIRTLFGKTLKDYYSEGQNLVAGKKIISGGHLSDYMVGTYSCGLSIPFMRRIMSGDPSILEDCWSMYSDW
ncbi:hypothetical protein Daus18300_014019 [Diaporthe australafricana]|uniref:Uncharacterized protein n=1 Tax=Diaporthe australafricana TaxID=127596 RepID=A0ABR3VWS9_9PEZI